MPSGPGAGSEERRRLVAPDVPRWRRRESRGKLRRLVADHAPSVRQASAIALGLLLTALAGLSVALATGWGNGEFRYGGSESASSATPAATRAVARPNEGLAASQLGAPISAGLSPTPAVVAIPALLTPPPLRPPGTPTGAALAPSSPLATGTPEPTVADVWQATVPQLDATWGVDTAQTITLLTTFLDRFPDYTPAQDKLYAALLAYGTELNDQGDVAGATQAFARAAALLPDREEAGQALARLTPTPLPEPPPARALIPLRRPTPAAVPPAAAAPRPPPADNPTPTKARFIPPS